LNSWISFDEAFRQKYGISLEEKLFLKMGSWLDREFRDVTIEITDPTGTRWRVVIEAALRPSRDSSLIGSSYFYSLSSVSSGSQSSETSGSQSNTEKPDLPVFGPESSSLVHASAAVEFRDPNHTQWSELPRPKELYCRAEKLRKKGATFLIGFDKSLPGSFGRCGHGTNGASTGAG